jgi:selenium-binding protein 1
MLNPRGGSDAMAVLDVDPESKAYGRQISQLDMPKSGDELHHFGWNACSSCLCPFASHPHMERRYLVVPGLRSSRIHILDTKANPSSPSLVKVIEPEEVAKKTDTRAAHDALRSRRHLHERAGSADGTGPGGIFVVNPDTFEIEGRWEQDRGPQHGA